MKAQIAEAVLSRADGKCEGCASLLGPYRRTPEIDHFFGRARAKDSEDSLWLLCRQCHRSKTDNYPHAAFWLRLFLVHCEKHGYRNSYDRAFKELGWREAKKKAGAA